MVRIPSEYQEVEYLESTGTQYIDLPFGFDPTDEVEITGAMLSGFGDKYMVAPKHWNTDNNRFAMLGGIYNLFVFSFGSQGTPNSILTPAVTGDTKMHTITYGNKIFTVVDTGSVADMSSKSFGSTTANLRLFYGYSNNTNGKIVYYHHKKADGTEINLIPCYRKSDSKPGMHDTVSGEFHVNQGTGEFLVGNNIYYDTTNLLESRRRILLTTPHLESPTPANPLTFKSNMTTKLKEGKVYFIPVQDLHGYDNPWPAGGGKNKFDYLDSNNWYVAETDKDRKKVSTLGSISVSNGVVKLSRSSVYAGLVLVLGQLKADQSYAFSGITTNIDGNAYIAKIDTTMSDEYTATRVFTISFSDNSVTFTPTEDGIYELLLWKSGVGDITIKNAQLELGNTATSYQPYENVCPITGWDGITVTKCGKNLLNPNDPDYANYTVSPTGEPKTTSADRITTGFIPCGENVTLVASSTKKLTDSVYMFVVISAWDKNKQFISRAAGNYRSRLTFTTPEGTCYVRYSEQVTGNKNPTPSVFTKYERQLELGSTPTAYEPYTETKITIPFPQTIYGGYVDLVNGEVVEEYTAVTLDGENVKVSKGGYPSTNFYGAGWVYAIPYGKCGVVGKTCFCDRLSYRANSSLTPFYSFPTNGYLYYTIRVLPKSDYPDGLTNEEVINLTNEWLKVNPTTFAYPLATPIHHTIDPQVIRPLKGVNNIWSDANGSIEIKFWKH